MIKRKINKNYSFNNNTEDTDLSDIFKEEKDLRTLSRKNLEDIYGNLLKNIDDLTKRQSELENKIDFLNKKNEDYVCKNKSISEELVLKK
jgi:hypothetical protein